MKPRHMILLLGLVSTLSLSADDAKPDLYPHGLGFSYWDHTGVGLVYRDLDSHEGWQVSGMATTNNWFTNHALYSLGGAKHFVLSSFEINEWLFSQFYWGAGGSWRTESVTKTVTRPNPNPVNSWDNFLYHQEKVWKNTVGLGPILGIEAGLFSHFSFNFELGYRIAYDLSESDPTKAVQAGPTGSVLVLVRF